MSFELTQPQILDFLSRHPDAAAQVQDRNNGNANALPTWGKGWLEPGGYYVLVFFDATKHWHFLNMSTYADTTGKTFTLATENSPAYVSMDQDTTESAISQVEGLVSNSIGTVGSIVTGVTDTVSTLFGSIQSALSATGKAFVDAESAGADAANAAATFAKAVPYLIAGIILVLAIVAYNSKTNLSLGGAGIV